MTVNTETAIRLRTRDRTINRKLSNRTVIRNRTRIFGNRTGFGLQSNRTGSTGPNQPDQPEPDQLDQPEQSQLGKLAKPGQPKPDQQENYENRTNWKNRPTGEEGLNLLHRLGPAGNVHADFTSPAQGSGSAPMGPIRWRGFPLILVPSRANLMTFEGWP